VNEFNLFVFFKGADASVRLDLVGWGGKAREYLRSNFAGDLERVRGTRFGDNIAKIAYITERSVMEPDIFRGVRDVQNRLQAGAIVEEEFDCLLVDALATAPWNILGSQPETVKGAGTSLMEELVKESSDLGFEGRLKLVPIQRARQFYTGIGFTETDGGELELTIVAALTFLEMQERRRRNER